MNASHAHFSFDPISARNKNFGPLEDSSRCSANDRSRVPLNTKVACRQNASSWACMLRVQTRVLFFVSPSLSRSLSLPLSRSLSAPSNSYCKKWNPELPVLHRTPRRRTWSFHLQERRPKTESQWQMSLASRKAIALDEV